MYAYVKRRHVRTAQVGAVSTMSEMDSDADEQDSKLTTWKEKVHFFFNIVFLALILIGLFGVILLRVGLNRLSHKDLFC